MVQTITLSELPLVFERLSKSIVAAVKMGIIESGDKATDYMKSIIKVRTRRQRKPGKKSILSYIQGYYNSPIARGSFYYGIGKISLLNSKAPYWNRIDKGFLPPSTTGYFKDRYGRSVYPPKIGISSTQVFYPSRKHWRMTPRNKFQGMRYAFKSYSFLMRKLGNNIDHFLKDVR